jgi:hypothetical protein
MLTLAEIDPAPGPDAALSARMCAAINLMSPAPPLVVVAHGSLAMLLPAIALSQRTAHRRVGAYVLIDPDLPPVTDSWPDAPVTVVTDDTSGAASLQGRLRGWQVLTHAMFRAQDTSD